MDDLVVFVSEAPVIDTSLTIFLQIRKPVTSIIFQLVITERVYGASFVLDDFIRNHLRKKYELPPESTIQLIDCNLRLKPKEGVE